jgi:hypothetical protein
MKWVLVKNVKSEGQPDRLATVVNEYGRRLVYNSKREAEQAAEDISNLDEQSMEMYEGVHRELMIRSMGPILIIPEQETFY